MTTGRCDRAEGNRRGDGETARAAPCADAPTTRRETLAGVTAVVGSAVAGCLGGTSGGDGKVATPTGGDGTPSRTENGGATTSGATGTSDGGATTPTRVRSLPAPARGPADAPVTVVAFEDFACPHCRQFALEVLPRIVDEYVADGRVRYEHRDFPIPVDPVWSWRAPGAARAVQDAEGAAAFFEFAARLYEHLGSYDAALIADLADDVGADGEAVRRAAVSERYRPVIAADRSRGLERGVEGTPAVFVEDEQLSGYSFETVAAAVESRL